MKNIHILPTDKPSRLAILHNGNLHIGTNFKKDLNVNPQHIYITNSEEIKEGDWVISEQMFLSPLYDPIGKIEIISVETKKIIQSDGSWYWTELETKKIILTTDQSLDGVQSIDDDFLEWFVKNQSCEEVETKLIEDIPSGFTFGMFGNDEPPTELVYKIIIPKEDYSGVHLRHCYQGEYEDGCKYGEDDCPAKPIEKPKQETLEEVAERIYQDEEIVNDYDISGYLQSAFLTGAKWQKNDCVQFINKLEDESFDGWSEEAISGYLTACMTIKQKYIDTLNGN